MAIFINEGKSINDNLFKYEERLKSPMSRFLDTTPVFVTYYHIDNAHTSADAGYKDVESILGSQSPIKYTKIANFPLYGLDQIIVQLTNGEQGLDGSYEGDAVVPINTIKPLMNDYFIIPTIKEPMLFRVSDIGYDTAMADNFYKITFYLEYNDEQLVTNINDQTIRNMVCKLDNIGTDNPAILEEDYYSELKNKMAIYNDIATTYYNIFYNDRHNCFLGEMGANQYLYDPYQTAFVNMHGLFNEKNNLKALILTDQFTDSKRRIKYEKSVYRFIERQNVKYISTFNYISYAGVTQKESSFHRWSDTTIQILDHPVNEDIPNQTPIFSKEFVTACQIDGPVHHEWANMIKKYIRKEKLSLTDITESISDEVIKLDGNLEVFFFGPIILYIMKQIMNTSVSDSYLIE